MRVLFVSKPVAEPFHDGSLCLVRDLALNLQRHTAHVMGVAGVAPTWAQSLSGPRPTVLPVYRRTGRYAPGLRQNARALTHLLAERQAQLWHFVFAPNPRTSGILRGLCKLRRMPSVQTIASPPRDFSVSEQILFGDVVVAQSEWTRSRVLQAAPNKQVEVIRPPLGHVARRAEAELGELRQRLQIGPEHSVYVYPGDLEFSGGAARVAEALPGLVARDPRALVVYACRRKTERARHVEAELQARLDPAKVRFAGELPSLLPLLQLARVVLFPVEDLWAKVDIPIAVLESMALGTPVVTLTTGPLSELSGPLQVPLNDPAALVDAACSLAADPQLRERVVAEQRQQLTAAFDAAVVAAQYEQLYDRFLPG